MKAKQVPLLMAASVFTLATLSNGMALAQTPPPATEKSSPSKASQAPDKKAAMPAGAVTRANAVIGETVRNSGGEKIGTVDDLLIGNDTKVNYVVVSVGGFLGIGDKLVAVPMKNVQMAADHLVLPSATKESVSRMPTFDPRTVDRPGHMTEVPKATPPSGSASDSAPNNSN